MRRDDIEEEDDQESYYNYMKNAPVVAYPDDEEELEYDSDGNPIAPEKSKVIHQGFHYSFAQKALGLNQLFLSNEVHIKIGRQGGVHRRSICPLPTLVGGGVASWSVCSTPDRVVWVQVLAGDIV